MIGRSLRRSTRRTCSTAARWTTAPAPCGSGVVRSRSPGCCGAHCSTCCGGEQPSRRSRHCSGHRGPELRTTDGQELVLCTARYVPGDVEALWAALSASMEEASDGSLLRLDADSTVLGSVERNDEQVVVTANAVDGCAYCIAVLEADPGARMLDESTVPFDALDFEGSPELPGMLRICRRWIWRASDGGWRIAGSPTRSRLLVDSRRARPRCGRRPQGPGSAARRLRVDDPAASRPARDGRRPVAKRARADLRLRGGPAAGTTYPHPISDRRAGRPQSVGTDR